MNIEPLKRIPNPPEVFKKWRCLIRGDEDKPDQYGKARTRLEKECKDQDAPRKVKDYEKRLWNILNHNIQWAEIALATDKVEFTGEGISPIEKIEIREGDKRKHGNTQWLLVCGFEFWMDEDHMKWRKLYVPLKPENSKFDFLRFVKGEKKAGPVLMPGSGERGYPMEWDEIENKVDDF